MTTFASESERKQATVVRGERAANKFPNSGGSAALSSTATNEEMRMADYAGRPFSMCRGLPLDARQPVTTRTAPMGASCAMITAWAVLGNLEEHPKIPLVVSELMPREC